MNWNMMAENTYWHKQTRDEPLFPDMLWNRPENRMHAGKLLIIGGNLHGFNAPAEAYGEALKAGAGTVRVILPNVLSKTIGKLFPEAEFAPSTPSGSFARAALAEFLDTAAWSDGVLLAGDFGRNSETVILLEKFIEKYAGQLTITKDTADYFAKSPRVILQRPETTLVISLSQLQQIATNAHFATPITFGMGLLQLVDTLHNFTQAHKANIITQHVDNIFVAVNGQASTTKLDTPQKIWRVKTAAHVATWWMQNPSKPFAALTTSVL